MSRGFLLVEVSITYVVLSLALVALVPLFILSIRANKKTEQLAVAGFLSQELLEEIRLRKWDQLTPSPSSRIASGSAVLGIDAGEIASDKTTFNDVDDFNGWSESPPTDPLMRPIPGFNAYTRTVTVAYVDSTLAASAAPTDYKQVTACAAAPAMVPACVSTVLVNR